MSILGAGPIYLGDQLVAGIRKWDEDAIEAAYLAAGSSNPRYYLRLTGSTPFAELGTSGRTWSSHAYTIAPPSELDGGFAVAGGLGSACVASANDNSPGTAHTVAMWVRRRGVVSVAFEFSHLFTHGDQHEAFSARSWTLRYDSAGVLSWQIFAGTSFAANTTGAYVLPLDVWTHVAVRHASGDQVIYINGTAMGTPGTSTSSTNNGSAAVAIGASTGTTAGGNHPFPGDIAHVAYWPETLTPTAIANIAAAGR